MIQMNERQDLADLIQSLRMLMWRTSRPLRDAVQREAWRLLYEMSDKDPGTLRKIADALQPTEPELAAEWDFLAMVFEDRAAIPVPPVDELLRRYVRGEIGDRTVMWVMDWDHRDLYAACAERDLPPIQMGEVDEEEVRPLLDLLDEKGGRKQ
jgi:hypothetical protein